MLALTMAAKFDRVLWLGPQPKNPRRQAVLQELLQLLEFPGAPDNAYAPDASLRQLALGNLEDWMAKPDAWPKPDGVHIYVGVLFSELPSSGDLLRLYDENQLSFILCDDCEVKNLREALGDLLD